MKQAKHGNYHSSGYITNIILKPALVKLYIMATLIEILVFGPCWETISSLCCSKLQQILLCQWHGRLMPWSGDIAGQHELTSVF